MTSIRIMSAMLTQERMVLIDIATSIPGRNSGGSGIGNSEPVMISVMMPDRIKPNIEASSTNTK